MITFDLACDQGHRFEGWFRNREDFDAQLERGLVSCPLCGSTRVEKRLSAVSVHTARRTADSRSPPVLPVAGDAGPSDPSGPSGPSGTGGDVRPFFQALAQVVETHFEDVGERFAEEARKLEKGETEARNIRGTTTAEEEEALREEGIEFMKIPIPKYDA